MRESSGRELQPGDTLGPYRLEELLGEGGMGLVFRGVHEDGHEVALKVMRFELIEDPVFGRRFEQEARAASEVREPHLVPVLDVGLVDGRRYLATAYVPGGTLEDRLVERERLDLAESASVTADVAAGLDALHAAGIVHRDLKPSNIILDAEGTAMLTDFGLAKGRAYTVLTKPGQVMGTIDYLAPELIKGEAASPATDIYALGCTIYECVTGQAPFADKEGIAVGLAHVGTPPPDPRGFRDDISDAYADALLSALAKEPGDRPRTASEYGQRLVEAASAGP